jgi:hypothetical protein
MTIWKYQRYDIYNVNPPLVRAVAALPVILFTSAKLSPPPPLNRNRLEFFLGNQFYEANKEDAIFYYRLARIACIPFSIIGVAVCYQWSKSLFGRNAGLASTCLWCFSPNILCWGSTICPDLAATSFGVLAFYCFWIYNGKPSLKSASLSGITLGLCLLTKGTWISLIAIFLIIEFVSVLCNKNQPICSLINFQRLFFILWILSIGIYILNCGYFFEGTFQTGDAYSFKSNLFTSINKMTGITVNNVPIPLPQEYVYGIDAQRLDFENGLDSFLLGKWSKHGWWYYYIICIVVKEPLAFNILFVWSVILICYDIVRQNKRILFYDIIKVLIPIVLIFCFISSQSGFSRHFRYMIPILPFMCIIIGYLFSLHYNIVSYKKFLPTVLLITYVIASLFIFPHSFSFFNIIAGGPYNGHYFLLDSNIDWQQDLLFLKKWQQQNHDKFNDIKVAYYGDTPPEYFGIISSGPPFYGRNNQLNITDDNLLGPSSGWFAISVHCLHHPREDYSYFLKFRPVKYVGYSIYIYHITPQEANRVRKEMGLQTTIVNESTTP